MTVDEFEVEEWRRRLAAERRRPDGDVLDLADAYASGAIT